MSLDEQYTTVDNIQWQDVLTRIKVFDNYLQVFCKQLTKTFGLKHPAIEYYQQLCIDRQIDILLCTFVSGN